MHEVNRQKGGTHCSRPGNACSAYLSPSLSGPLPGNPCSGSGEKFLRWSSAPVLCTPTREGHRVPLFTRGAQRVPFAKPEMEFRRYAAQTRSDQLAPGAASDAAPFRVCSEQTLCEHRVQQQPRADASLLFVPAFIALCLFRQVTNDPSRCRPPKYAHSYPTAILFVYVQNIFAGSRATLGLGWRFLQFSVVNFFIAFFDGRSFVLQRAANME